jgi:hypothetical protein
MTTRTARPVYAIPTGDNSIGTAVRIGSATSITSAIAQCRAAGHRVMTKGGNIGTETHSSVCGGDSDALVWAVSVYA